MLGNPAPLCLVLHARDGLCHPNGTCRSDAQPLLWGEDAWSPSFASRDHRPPCSLSATPQPHEYPIGKHASNLSSHPQHTPLLPPDLPQCREDQKQTHRDPLGDTCPNPLCTAAAPSVIALSLWV